VSSLGCADPGCVGLPPTVVRRLHAAEAGHLVCVLKPPFVLPQYFVSSGFAFVHPDSTAEVCAVEAVPLEHLDGAAVKEVRSRCTPPRPTRRCAQGALMHAAHAAYSSVFQAPNE
jgi:hypothetical protein